MLVFRMYMLLKQNQITNCTTGVPGVLSVQLDENFESDNKDYGGNNLLQARLYLTV